MTQVAIGVVGMVLSVLVLFRVIDWAGDQFKHPDSASAEITMAVFLVLFFFGDVLWLLFRRVHPRPPGAELKDFHGRDEDDS